MTVFHRIFVVSAFAVLLLVLAGCVHRLPEGRYTASGRNDYALVNNDLLFLHISTPQENPSKLAFWDWAGPYSLSKEGILKPDMESELWKKWSFYYSFVYSKNSIRVVDKREGRAIITLFLESPTQR